MKGLDIFREHFAKFSDHYVLIGGTACDLAFSAAGIEFRATRDLDIVLMIESLDEAFGQTVMDFVEAGGYEHRRRTEGDEALQFYRFTKPKRDDYPSMLELFSRPPDLINLHDEGFLTPIPIEESSLSLSAILMDEGYYELIKSGRMALDGISTVKPEILIPLKARAWIDLTARKAIGETVDSKDIKKHKNDVFRLFALLTEKMRVKVTESIHADLMHFLKKMEEDPPDIRSLGLSGLKFEDVTAVLRKIYVIK